MSPHGVLSESLTESSVSRVVRTHDRKGREGKGREVGNPSILPTGSARPGFDFRGRPLDGRRWMAADAAIGGGL